MAASNEHTDRHLVPNGWVRGTTLRDSGKIQVKMAPADCVMTARWRETCNGYGPVYGSSESLWSSKDTVKIDLLTGKFGPSSKSL